MPILIVSNCFIHLNIRATGLVEPNTALAHHVFNTEYENNYVRKEIHLLTVIYDLVYKQRKGLCNNAVKFILANNVTISVRNDNRGSLQLSFMFVPKRYMVVRYSFDVVINVLLNRMGAVGTL